MKVTDLYNINKEEFETVESFAKRVYETANRVSISLSKIEETVKVIFLLAKFYKESYSDIVSAIGGLSTSQNYRIFFYTELGERKLNVEKRYNNK